MAGRRFALIAKTHHALVDGISGVDITTVLFDAAGGRASDRVGGHHQRASNPPPWSPRPLPGSAKLLGEALLERTTVPGEMARGARRVVRRPLRALAQLRDGLANVGATTLAGINAPAPPHP